MAEKASSKKGGQEAGGFGGFGGFGGGGGGGGADKKSVSLYKKFDILFYFSTVWYSLLLLDDNFSLNIFAFKRF